MKLTIDETIDRMRAAYAELKALLQKLNNESTLKFKSYDNEQKDIKIKLQNALGRIAVLEKQISSKGESKKYVQPSLSNTELYGYVKSKIELEFKNKKDCLRKLHGDYPLDYELSDLPTPFIVELVGKEGMDVLNEFINRMFKDIFDYASNNKPKFYFVEWEKYWYDHWSIGVPTNKEKFFLNKTESFVEKSNREAVESFAGESEEERAARRKKTKSIPDKVKSRYPVKKKTGIFEVTDLKGALDIMGGRKTREEAHEKYNEEYEKQVTEWELKYEND